MGAIAVLIGLALAVSVLVVVHELGHLAVARWCGIKVVRFSIGFGPTLFCWPVGRDPVRCVVKLIPLGGFVQMLDERASAVSAEELPRAFTRVHPAKRLATLAAGPAANLLLGILLLGLLLWHDGAVRMRPIVGQVARGSIAARAGLRKGDVIEAVGVRAVRTRGEARARIVSTLRSRGVVRLTVSTNGSSHPVMLSVPAEGSRSTLSRLGVRFAAVRIAAKIARVVPGGPAAKAGLEAGDRIVSIDGHPVHTWPALLERIRPLPGKLVRLGVLRGRHVLTLPVRIGRQVIGGRAVGSLWVRAAAPVTPMGWTVRIRYGPLDAIGGGARMALRLAVLEARAAWNLITLRSSVRDFADARWIAALSGGAAGDRGSLLAFLAEISLTLGLVNLLPVPGLDGAQLLFELAQWVRGISEEHSEMSVAGRLPGNVECGRAPGDRPAARK